MGKAWTQWERDIIRANYETLNDDGLAKLLEGRTIGGISEQRYAMGLGKKVHTWTDEEKQIIKDNLHLSCLELAKMFPQYNTAQVNAARNKVKLTLAEPEPVKEKVMFPSDWKPSYIKNEFDEDMMLAVKIQQMLRPLMKGWVRK